MEDQCSINIYSPAPNLGRAGVSKNCFDDLFASFRIWYQPDVKPDSWSGWLLDQSWTSSLC